MSNFQAKFISALGTANSLRGQLIRGGLGTAGVRICHATFAFIISVILARNLGTKDFGIYSFVYALVMLLAVPGQHGLSQLVLRETAKFDTEGRWDLMRGIWRWSNISGLLFSTLIFILVTSILLLIKNPFDDQKTLTIFIALWLIPLITLGNLRGAALMGLRRVALGQLPDSVVRPALLITFVIIIWNFPQFKLTSSSAMFLHAIAALIAFSFGAWILWRYRPIKLIEVTNLSYRSNIWIRSALPLALIAGLQVISTYTDIVMLGFLRSDEEVGIYRVVAQNGLLVAFVMQTIGMIVAPHFARLYTKKDSLRLQKIVTSSTQIIFLISIPMALIFSIWGIEILRFLFGEEYTSGHTALTILSIGFLIFNAFGLVGLLLQMTGHEKDTVIGLSCSAILNIILNFFLIPLYGINGAAIATVICVVISQLLLWRFVKLRLGIESSLFGMLRTPLQNNN